MSIRDAYINPEVVVIATFGLVFMFIVSALDRMNIFGKNRSARILVAIILAIFTAYQFWDAVLQLYILNTTLYLVALGLGIFLLIILLRFLKKQF
jgi:hypothetical protein